MLTTVLPHFGGKHGVSSCRRLPGITRHSLLVMLAAVTLAVFPSAHGATTPDTKQKAQEALKQAQTRLTNDQRDLQKAGPDLTDAATRVQQARYKAAQKLAPGLGVTAALQAQTDAADAVTDMQKKLLDLLKQQRDYQAAVQAASEVSPKLQALEENVTISDEDRAKQQAKLSAISRRPGELRKERVENNADLLAAQQAFNDAKTKATQLRAQLAKAVEEDADVKAALDDWKQKQAALQKAQAAVNADQQAITSEQAAVGRDKTTRRRPKHS